MYSANDVNKSANQGKTTTNVHDQNVRNTQHGNAPVLSATSIVGTGVRNTQGESLGDIKDLMIDTTNGTISYAVVSFGGFLGIGDKLFAVPLEAFRVDTEHEKFILDVSREQLENAPGFDKDNWPTTAQQDFIQRVYTHYGYQDQYNRRYV
ncbi:PRC-barrel domain-containing protein [Catalinimonas alkaloidigena]|uniref:PRC-barrel domain-containing protein n=1 Tax=Catalinimonas alkaloidigena TaxID=1075417 RepID=A0A1G9MQV4_9BACT|nr:PRC-barrel domain-containing protein [Catalinimonas alkaloidigena]SDL76630.1 PRC-barrel domain-containing protein [Catalinimonas alkaloidigena]